MGCAVATLPRTRLWAACRGIRERLNYFFRDGRSNTWWAAIFASPSRIPELLMTASGHSFSAARCKREKSSALIFTLTCTVRLPVGCITPYGYFFLLVSPTMLLVLFVTNWT